MAIYTIFMVSERPDFISPSWQNPLVGHEGKGVLDIIREMSGEEWVTADENIVRYYVRMIQAANKTISVACSSSSVVLVDGEILDDLEEQLKQGVNVEIVFDDEKDLPGQDSRLAGLKQQHGNKLRLFRINGRARLQFMVVDGQDILIEEPDHVGNRNYEAVIINKDTKLGKEWQGKFESARDKF